MKLRLSWLLAALLILPLSACDETGGSTSPNVDLAVSDAVTARQSGNYSQAVTILEEAMQANPQSAPVRVELAATVMERDGIDLLDLDRIASFVTEGAATTQAATRSASRNACAYAADPTAVEFDPAGAADLPDIKAKRETIKRTLALLDEILPEALTGFDLCTTIVNGELVYDHAAAATHLRGKGLTNDQIARLLAVNALARFLDAYLFVTEDVTTQTTWYRLADGSIGVCADDQDALEAQARDAVDDIGQSLLSLDLRSRTFAPGSASSEIVTLAVDAFEEIRDAVGEYCATSI
ncbi:MAG: tetratricopeptide repeat protein [Bacteroidota bacterium]